MKTNGMDIALRTNMQRLFVLITILFCWLPADAQTATATDPDTTLYAVRLKEVMVKARWKNDTERYRYNQMKYYVTTILPYLNAATKVFKEINAEVENADISRKERRQFIGRKEDEMRTAFEDKVKALNVTQGGLLVKLIARQTEVNIYKILTEFKNPLTAVKWQTWARVNGLNLNRKYEPEEEPILENIMDELGYPLPAGYSMSQNVAPGHATD
jgi:Domain of unknown function (DUF4294)